MLFTNLREGVISREFQRKYNGSATRNSPPPSGETTTFIIGIYLRRTRLWYALLPGHHLRHVLHSFRRFWQAVGTIDCTRSPVRALCAIGHEDRHQSAWFPQGLASLYPQHSCGTRPRPGYRYYSELRSW